MENYISVKDKIKEAVSFNFKVADDNKKPATSIHWASLLSPATLAEIDLFAKAIGKTRVQAIDLIQIASWEQFKQFIA